MGELVDGERLGLLAPILAGTLEALRWAVLPALAVAYFALGMVVFRRLVPPDYFALPILVRLAILGGLVGGVVLIRASPVADLYAVSRIFPAGGAWDIPVDVFLAERANPLLYRLGDVARRIVETGTVDGFVLTAAAVAAIALTGIVLSFVYLGPRDGAVAAILGIAVMVWTAYLLVYLAALLYYAMHKLNFWSILAFAAVFQLWRARRH